jgi:hypothetical protein
VFPTNDNFPEEKFRFHALRNASFVNPLPRGFGAQWHLQYSFFTDKKLPVFDELAQATRAIHRIETAESERKHALLLSGESSASASAPAAATAASGQENVFTSYLIRNVRRIDERTSHLWMSELASGKRSVQDLVQAYGVPFKQWRPVPNVSKCPLLEYVVRYRPGYAEATWFIRVNVIYTEMHEIKRDSQYRVGDWFFNPRRLQRRSQGWTEQLIDYLHSVARLSSKTSALKRYDSASKVPVAPGGSATASPSPVLIASVLTDKPKVVPHHLRGDVGIESVSAPSTPAASPPQMPSSGGTSNGGMSAIASPQLTFHEKWSYVLKLSEFQFKAGLLDRLRYFDGLLSLLQKVLSPRSLNGNCSSVVAIGVNETMELVTVIQTLLPEILFVPDAVLLLVKTLLQHLRYLVLPGMPIPEELGSSLHEELVLALCNMLRDILLSGPDVLVRLEDNSTCVYWTLISLACSNLLIVSVMMRQSRRCGPSLCLVSAPSTVTPTVRVRSKSVSDGVSGKRKRSRGGCCVCNRYSMV